MCIHWLCVYIIYKMSVPPPKYFLGGHHLYMYFCVFVCPFVCTSVRPQILRRGANISCPSQYILSINEYQMSVPPPLLVISYMYDMSVPPLYSSPQKDVWYVRPPPHYLCLFVFPCVRTISHFCILPLVERHMYKRFYMMCCYTHHKGTVCASSTKHNQQSNCVGHSSRY